MRAFLISLASMAWASSALAAQTYTVPVTVVPGSVQIDGTPGLSVPFSQPFTIVQGDITGNCTVSGTLSSQLVNGGLEVELNVTAIGNGPCRLSLPAQMTLQMEVPEFPGTVTMVRLERTRLIENLPTPVLVDFSLYGSQLASSSSVPDYFRIVDLSALYLRNGGSPTAEPIAASLIPLIPGDTVEMPILLQVRTEDTNAYSGTVRIRYEFKVTVPEPTASLSFPIGALTVFGLASRRG